MHRLAVQPVHRIAGGAATFQKGRRQQGGVEGPQLGGEHIHLERIVAAQGGIAATHQLPAADPAALGGLLQCRCQRAADLAHPLPGRLGRQGARVGQQEQQRRRVTQALQQGGVIPAQQQRAAMHGLRAGGVVIEDDDLGWRQARVLHGTIVP